MLTLAPQQIAVGPPPLPGGIAAVLRFFFNLPQWFQIGGLVVGVAVGVAVVWLAWRRRAAIAQWLVSRPRSTKLALAATVGVLALLGGGTGAYGYHYMEHNNGFCTGCHVMNGPFQRFTGSKHDSLECHNCHQQGMVANLRQLYLWVADRPQQIGKHAKVPSRVCANCHVRGDAKETWQRIASTAGHRTHLQSDSSALRNVQCVTCHGYEVHRFVPVDSTCAQSGCHVNVQIKLAGMKGQTDLHCVVCHRFTAEVPALATYDSARGTLVPKMGACLSCHQMRAALAEFDPARDPHRGTCGDCHNPHTQDKPRDAALTCASANCHADWRSQPFHVGKNHRAVVQDCTLCHEPHHAKVDPSDCAGCHAAVKERKAGRRLNPPLPFDTTQALRRVSWTGPESRSHGPSAEEPSPGGGPSEDDAAADSFPHARHKALSCITCHASKQVHGQLTFEAPRGCQICHHQAPQTSDCSRCHSASDLAQPIPVEARVTVTGIGFRSHAIQFEHARHHALRCVSCHTTQATLEPESATATCAACHDDHHAAGRHCAACHTSGGEPALRAAHAPPAEAHVACDQCHAPAIVARLVPDRLLCLTCHASQQEHHADRECTACHLQGTPEEAEAHLRKAAG